MARHNRDARGTDQRGFDYEISYQPDWVRLIKVTRSLESGRQSTKTLFKNPVPREQSPGSRIRTRIGCKEQNLEFEIELDDPRGVVARVIVVMQATPESAGEALEFTIDNRLTTPVGE
ncbi:MAG TPA: hypothetical protein VK864_13245 [Longimicrobiales bacterium]|nr:hypothetical protein [Longimicrobiales bacterium]